MLLIKLTKALIDLKEIIQGGRFPHLATILGRYIVLS